MDVGNISSGQTVAPSRVNHKKDQTNELDPSFIFANPRSSPTSSHFLSPYQSPGNWGSQIEHEVPVRQCRFVGFDMLHEGVE